MSRRLGVTVAVMVAVALLTAALLWWSDAEDVSLPAELPSPVVEPPSVVEPRAATPSPVTAPSTLRIVATLRAEGSSRPDQARVGAAVIRDEDRASWEEERREGHPAPASPLELANVPRWTEATISAEGVVGPVEVELAPLYRVAAWAKDGTFWWAEKSRPEEQRIGLLDLGAIPARSPTGLRVELRGAVRGLRLARVADDRASQEVLTITRLARPDLAAALEGEQVLAISDGEVLAPLPPDPAVRVTAISLSGREAPPIEVPLREGRIESVRIDPGTLFPDGEGRRVTLHGRVTLAGRPLPPGARLERLDPNGAELLLPPDGHFTLADLPSWQPSRFALLLPARAGRPLGPQRWEFQLDEPQGDPVDRTWTAPAYGWLVLTLDGGARVRLDHDAQAPYPVYLLERLDDAGAWKIEPADRFLREEDSLAISLTRPGRYRVLAAVTPFDVSQSGEARVSDVGGDHPVRLRSGEQVAASCTVQVTDGGRAVYAASITAAGGRPSLPPVRGLTDAAGRFSLGRIGPGATVLLEVGSPTGASQQLDATKDCRATGEVVVRL